MPAFFSKSQMADLLITAWEGGSAYWIELAEYVPPKGMTIQELHKLAWDAAPEEVHEFWGKPKGVPLYALLAFLPPSVQWKVKLTPVEDETPVFLTPQNIRAAAPKLAKAYPKIFARIKDEQYDALDADAWVQMAAFGEVIFG